MDRLHFLLKLLLRLAHARLLGFGELGVALALLESLGLYDLNRSLYQFSTLNLVGFDERRLLTIVVCGFAVEGKERIIE